MASPASNPYRVETVVRDGKSGATVYQPGDVIERSEAERIGLVDRNRSIRTTKGA